ncbi:MAG: aspartate-semialdehyde dehydrogenase [Armatimonadetes bacterium]|nr:aspartate-semialdehyde dehydrogenase [Armatimonadota bacterium]
MSFRVAVVGATGLVGNEMLRVLEERSLPLSCVIPLATSRSSGSRVSFRKEELIVEDVEAFDFSRVDLALFAGGEIASKDYASRAVQAGAVVIDNSSAFRMDPEVPLVVPEVNACSLVQHQGIVANPNCSTIQMVMVLKPLVDKVGLRRVIVTTFQSVSGTGKDAITELETQTRALMDGQRPERRVYPHRIAFNLFPQIGSFGLLGYCEEEWKMIKETQKILNHPDLAVTATTVRVPVVRGHSESLLVETERPITCEEAVEILSGFDGVRVMDQNTYPVPEEAAGRDEVFVGRIRQDTSSPNGLHMWVVADNIRKGAALNAVQIAEVMCDMGLLQEKAEKS